MVGEVLGEKTVIGVQRMGSGFSRSRGAAAGLRSDRLHGTHGTYGTERAFPQSHLTSHISLPTVKSCLFMRVTFHFSRC